MVLLSSSARSVSVILGVFGLGKFTCRHCDITGLASDTVESGRDSKSWKSSASSLCIIDLSLERPV